MNEDIALPFDLPSVCRKKLSVGFDGGRLSSDAGLLLLRGIERQLGLAARLAGCIREWRDPERIEHSLVEMLKLRMFAIAAGYEDANDCGSLRHDPVFKMAVGRLPESGDALCSQPTMSRLENAPSKIELGRMMAAMVDQFCDSYSHKPRSIVLDIDDTFDAVHGHQQLSLFNAHYDERCFLPIHIYEGASGKPVAMILRTGKTPSGKEVRTVSSMSSDASESTGRRCPSWYAATATMAATSRWNGAKTKGLTTFLASAAATPLWTRWSARRPMRCASSAPRVGKRSCAVTRN